jgi:hypothetical protein
LIVGVFQPVTPHVVDAILLPDDPNFVVYEILDTPVR